MPRTATEGGHIDCKTPSGIDEGVSRLDLIVIAYRGLKWVASRVVAVVDKQFQVTDRLEEAAAAPIGI